MLPSLSLPPLEFCFGTSPTQAEKSRPDRKALGSAMLATSAVASAGPTPGIASSRLLVAFDRCQAQPDTCVPLPGVESRLDQRRLPAVARHLCARPGRRSRTRQDRLGLS